MVCLSYFTMALAVILSCLLVILSWHACYLIISLVVILSYHIMAWLLSYHGPC